MSASVRDRMTPSAIGTFEWAALVAAFVILVIFRLHAFDLPLETDECNYAVIAARMLGGDRLYVDVWDHQPFGIFVLFAAVIGVFGDSPPVFRWMALAFSAVSLLLIFGILRLMGGRNAAILGAILFSLGSSDPGTAGEGCNREIYMNTFILAAWYFTAKSDERRNLWLLAAGAVLAIASSLKTIAAVHWGCLALWIVVSEARATRPTTAITQRLAWFALGPTLFWGAALGYFAISGRFGEFAEAVFLFNVGYTESGEPFFMRFMRFFAPVRHQFIFDSALPLWIAAGIGSIWLIVEIVVRRDRRDFAMLLLLLASFVAICLPGRFWPHYYYLMLPALVLVVSLMTARFASWIGGILSLKKRGSVLVQALAYLPIPIALTVTEGRDYLFQPSFGITVKRYNSRDFWGRAQGHNIASVTNPEDSIFVFGNDASLYYYSRRSCASRYTMITGLSQGMHGAEQRRETLVRELRAELPRLVVVLFDEAPFEEWKAFLRENYGEPVGWDYHDEKGEPIMFVLGQKDRPIPSIDWNWDRSIVGGWSRGERR